MVRRGVGVVAGILLACCACASALDPSLDISQYAHASWKNREGFAKGYITAIAQTPDGYLWLGTEFGLLRFDGIRAVPWQPPSGEQLASSFIRRLLVSRDGTLWIGTLNGLASWKTGKLTHYAELHGQSVFALVEDREGTVWAGGRGTSIGRLCAIRSGGVQCYGEDGILGGGVFGLYEDSHGNLWAGVVNGIWRWKPGRSEFYPLLDEPNGIQSYVETTEGAFLIGTHSGLKQFVDGKAEGYPLARSAPQFFVSRLLRDRDGGLWAGTDHGLAHIHNGRMDLYALSQGLSGDFVNSIFEDREGNIWVATNDGLDRFRSFAVSSFTASQGPSNVIPWSVLAAKDGSIWIGSRGGLARWDRGRGSRSIKAESLEEKTARAKGARTVIPDSLFEGSQGRIWVSTVKEFGYLENNRLAPVEGVPGGTVHSIAEDAEGNLWIAYQELGLFELRPNGVVQHIPWAGLGHKDYAFTLLASPFLNGLWLGFAEGGIAYFSGGCATCVNGSK